MPYTIDLMSDCSERVPYNMPGFPAYARRAALSIYQGMGASNHWHDDLEFGVIVSGYMTYAVNGAHLRVGRGEGIFINARQLHGNFSADGSDCEYVCALLHPSLLRTAPHIDEALITPLMQNGGFTHAILRQDTPWQAALMDTVLRIHGAFESGEATLALAVQALANEAASLLCANMPPPSPLPTRVDRRIAALRSMVGFVQLHYEERITLSDIAAAGSVSQSSCCAIFRQQMRQTPVGYLARYRVEKGMALLAQPDLSITDVALAVGFSSASYFTETFHKLLGLTPTEYRQQTI